MSKRPRRGLSAVLEGFRRPSGKLLVAVNLGLLVGVVRFGWSVFDVVFLYWAENLVIGAINVLKMVTASPAPREDEDDVTDAAPSERLKAIAIGWALKLLLIPFFLFHYGFFCLGHGILLFAMFDGSGVYDDDIRKAFAALFTGALGLSLALLTASHLFSFLVNYLGRGEFRRTTAGALMLRPYGRIVALHVTIIVGGFIALATGDHLAMLMLLVVLKTFVDLAMHGRERQKYLDPDSIEDAPPIMAGTPADGGSPSDRRKR